jgi:hypothetical protein
MCGRTCEYTSNVKAALVCPSCSDTTIGETRLRTDPHLRLTGFRLPRRFGFAQATGSLTIGGVDDIKITVVEVYNIARRELGPSHLSSGCDLCACVAERSSARQ